MKKLENFKVNVDKTLIVKVVLLVIFVLATACLFFAAIQVNLSYKNRSLFGSQLAGQKASNKTYSELINLAKKTTVNFSISLEYGGVKTNPGASDLGLNFNFASTANNVLKKSNLEYLFTGYNYPILHNLNQDKLESYISNNFSNLSNKSIGPQLNYNIAKSSFEITSGKSGQRVDIDKLASEINSSANKLKSVHIKIPAKNISANLTSDKVKIITSKANNLSKLSIKFTYDNSIKYTVSAADMSNWFYVDYPDLDYSYDNIYNTISDKLAPLVNKDETSKIVTNGKITVNGANGQKISNLSSLTDQIISALKSKKSISLAIQTKSIAYETITASGRCVANASSSKLILVDISEQHMWACEGTTEVSDSAVTTGASALTNVDNATPTGTWSIYGKATNRTLTGSDVNGGWNDFVYYWMPFYGGYGFHDSTWQTFDYGSSLYKTEGSHGCVHVPLAEMGWLYNWSEIGTTVTIVD